jgi:predicted dehydrogenase
MLDTTNGSNETLRVGVIALGWAGEQHLIYFQAQPNVEVVAIADERPSRLAELQTTYGVKHVYQDYRELLKRDDLHAVSIASPNYLHAPMAIAALERGLHVLIEKPLARSVAEGEAMVQAAVENHRTLMTIFNQRRNGDVMTLKRYIDQVGMGHIYHAKASWMRRNGIPGMGGWFTNHEMAGGGPLIDLGVHVLDMALFLLGEPEVLSVSAATYSELGPRGKGSRSTLIGPGGYNVEDLATAFIRLQGGVTLLLEASWATYSGVTDEFGVQLFGSEGGARLHIKDYDRQDTVTIFTDIAGAPVDIRPQVPLMNGHNGVVSEFIDVIRSGTWADHVGREGLRRAQIIEACYKSAREGREIQLVDAASKV